MDAQERGTKGEACTTEIQKFRALQQQTTASLGEVPRQIRDLWAHLHREERQAEQPRGSTPPHPDLAPQLLEIAVVVESPEVPRSPVESIPSIDPGSSAVRTKNPHLIKISSPQFPSSLLLSREQQAESIG